MSARMLSLKAPSQEELSDEEVVDRVRAGETYLFELITRRYNQRLFRVTQSILRNDEEAQDVMQDAYVRAYIHLDQFAGKAKFSTWLIKIAVYESLVRAKRAKRFVLLKEGDHQRKLHGQTNEQGNPENILCRNRIGQLLEKAICALPAKYRAVFVLRNVEGLSTQETSVCLGISEEAVKTRLHRARFLLRNKLGKGIHLKDLFPFAGNRCATMTLAVMRRIACSKEVVSQG
jgi:RNA polymerase sigma-70 factor (ECF subfamily)